MKFCERDLRATVLIVTVKLSLFNQKHKSLMRRSLALKSSSSSVTNIKKTTTQQAVGPQEPKRKFYLNYLQEQKYLTKLKSSDCKGFNLQIPFPL